MNWFSRLLNRPEPPVVRAAPVAATTGASGRPSYASGIGINNTVTRSASLKLLEQFYQSIPALSRTVDILAGFVGVPEFECESASETELLNKWATNVPFGAGIGMGLKPWLSDLVGQGLVYGFSVGEAAIAPARNEVERLWTYVSPAHVFESDAAGMLRVFQAGRAMRRELNPETTATLTYRPRGCNPNGESLFFSIPTVSQTWLDILFNYRATWRRCGTPKFHVHWEAPETFNDSATGEGESSVTATVVAALEEQWQQGMHSQVVDGNQEDYFTGGSGKITVTTIGHDGQVMGIQEAKRNIVEEIVVATGIPGWMLGYATWSSTERLSTQQADMLLSAILSLRQTAEGTLRKTIDLRQRLAARRRGLAYQIVWPTISLQDASLTARTALLDAQAMKARQSYAQQLWMDGVWNQADYSEYLTGNPDVRRVTALPTLFQNQQGNVSAQPGQLVVPNGNGKAS